MAATMNLIDYSGIPHRHHVYASSGRAKALVHKSITMGSLFRHIDYMANLVGIDHVGFASDYIPTADFSAAMGAKGVLTAAPHQIIAAPVDVMLHKGRSEEDCSTFLGGKLCRVMGPGLELGTSMQANANGATGDAGGE